MALAPTLPVRPATPPQPLRPMGAAESLALFGIPALLLVLAMYGLQPALINLGLAPDLSTAACLILITGGLLVAAIVGYLREGHPLMWTAFATRMRLGRLGWREWKWTLGGFLVMGVLELVLSVAAMAVMSALQFVPPNVGSLGDNLALIMVGLVFNIVGEEVWWRGYLLPRQELAFGERTWLVHGLLWAGFHIFRWWQLPTMMISCLVIPFVAQRTKNTTPGIIIHSAMNVISTVPFLIALVARLVGAGG